MERHLAYRKTAFPFTKPIGALAKRAGMLANASFTYAKPAGNSAWATFIHA
jgi:hypothetical protein